VYFRVWGLLPTGVFLFFDPTGDVQGAKGFLNLLAQLAFLLPRMIVFTRFFRAFWVIPVGGGCGARMGGRGRVHVLKGKGFPLFSWGKDPCGYLIDRLFPPSLLYMTSF